VTLVGRALAAVDEHVPERFVRFDALIDESGLVSDLHEYSAKIAGALEPYRATHYFDVGRHEPALVHGVAELFLRQADALGNRVDERFAAWLRSLGAGAQERVLQMVLGIDDRADATTARQKIYFVLRPSHGAFVGEALDALGASVPPGLPIDLTYILGADFGQEGLRDTKLYFVLDRDRVPKVVDPLPEIFSGTRLVVMQHCLKDARRQIFFHLESFVTAWRTLEARAENEPEAHELLRRVRGMSATILPFRLEAAIFAFPIHERRLDPHAYSVYFQVE
jgi:hypothetical protein